MKDEDIRTRAIILSFVGISFLIAIFTLSISIRHKYYQQFLSELMMLVLVSEILYGITRFISFAREDPFQPMATHLIASLIQLICGIFCDTSTLLTNLFICMTISDSIVNNAQFFDKPKMRIISRIIIFSLSLIIMIIFILWQVFKYEDNTETICNLLSCELNSNINFYLLIFLIILTVAIIAAMIIPIVYLSIKGRSLKRSSTLDDQLKVKIKKIQCKLMIFPIVNVVFWGWKLVHQFVTIATGMAKYGSVYLWFYSIINGFRGSIYSLMFIICNDELRMAIRRMICFCSKQKTSYKTLVMEIPDFTVEDTKLDDDEYDGY